MKLTDNGDGSFTYTPGKLPDDEFTQLAPPVNRVWGLRVSYRSVSGKVVPRHDYYDAVINSLGRFFDIIFMTGVAAALFIVMICCIPGAIPFLF